MDEVHYDSIGTILEKLQSSDGERVADGLKNLYRRGLYTNFDRDNEYIIRQCFTIVLNIFKEPTMDLTLLHSANCIAGAFHIMKTKKDSILSQLIQPRKIAKYIKKNISQKKGNLEVVAKLLEVVFVLSETALQNDIYSLLEIDVFFQVYHVFDNTSRVKCLKAINSIIENNMIQKYADHIPQLLEITFEKHDKISDLAAKAFLTLIDKTTNLNNNVSRIGEFKFTLKLCSYVSTCTSKLYLAGFLKVLQRCLNEYPTTIRAVLNENVDWCRFFTSFKNTNDCDIIESALRLILNFFPQPQMKNSNSTVFDGFKWSKSQNHNQIYQIRDLIIPHLYNILCTKIVTTPHNIPLICFQALAVFAESTSFHPPDSFIYTLYFFSKENSIEYAPYLFKIIQSIADKKRIVRSGIIKRLKKNQVIVNNFHNQYTNQLREIEKSTQNIPSMNDSNYRITDIHEFLNKIETGEIIPFDFVPEKFIGTEFNSEPKNSLFLVVKNIIDYCPDLDALQPLATFFLNMLENIPIALPYFDKYFDSQFSYIKKETIKILHFGKETEFNFSDTLFQKELYSSNTNANIRDIDKKFPGFFDIEKIISQAQKSEYIKHMLNQVLDAGYQSYTYSINKKTVDINQHILNILSNVVERPDQIDSVLNCTIENNKSSSEPQKLPEYEGEDVVKNILLILNILYQKKHNLKLLNHKLIEKLEFQLRSIFMTVGIISPCSRIIVNYPFLFPFETRLFFFNALTNEPNKLLEQYMKKYHPEFSPKEKHMVSDKIEIFINRDQIFKQGLTILENFAKYKVFLEFSFKSDVGFGFGPTRQFFDLMSHEFCKKRHRIWRVEGKCKMYAKHHQGLFPLPTAKDSYMVGLGRFCAKAIQMGMLIDIPFNPAFFELVNGHDVPLSAVDDNHEMYFQNPVGVDDWGLAFEYPIGFNKSIDMVKQGSQKMVTSANFSQYREKFIDFTVGKYVKLKAARFREGFAEVINPEFLKLFTGEEICNILNGNAPSITYEDLKAYIHTCNGYAPEDPEIGYLYEIVPSMSQKEQLLLIQFITGSSRLPIGGLKNVNPPISIAKKDGEKNSNQQLPSVSTCSHYFKLPPYESKEVMREKLLTAIYEGQQSFQLS
ncbi:hypothetical protein TRFO_24453 [Tritrichomonas foetus]|uniref:HECT domain-containing protein n=1 Tax=Tritrichomonas foetus TaxID=1144522 RepID=A0A1J4K908_9EUKA|nr:hypothetical protein TRFO_24453 [Tritrichomonas foetus]|eukprot:OHT07368.1 hypothetical protein TRFO_24453 [Tritrichomonas foetus]